MCAYSIGELMLLKTLSSDDTIKNLATQLLATIEENKKLQEDATTDAMTGLYNRRGYEQLAKHHQAAANRHGGCGVVLSVDANGLKGVNDTLGHDAGDAYICHIGSLLAQCLRDTDVVARPGGDEFVVILPQLTLEQADSVVDKILHAMGTIPLVIKDKTMFASISLGVAAYGGKVTIHGALQTADQDMYTRKRAHYGA